MLLDRHLRLDQEFSRVRSTKSGQGSISSDEETPRHPPPFNGFDIIEPINGFLEETTIDKSKIRDLTASLNVGILITYC